MNLQYVKKNSKNYSRFPEKAAFSIVIMSYTLWNCKSSKNHSLRVFSRTFSSKSASQVVVGFCTDSVANTISCCSLGNKFYISRLLRIKKVRDEDMHRNFTCMLQADESTQTRVVKLKKGMA